MATTTVTRTFEYDNAGRVVREVTVTETIGPYASGGVVVRNEPGPEVVVPLRGQIADAASIHNALLRLKRQRGGGELGLS